MRVKMKEKKRRSRKIRKKRALLSRPLLHLRASLRKRPQVMIVMTLMIRLWLY
jgi:hypothetical protein